MAWRFPYSIAFQPQAEAPASGEAGNAAPTGSPITTDCDIQMKSPGEALSMFGVDTSFPAVVYVAMGLAIPAHATFDFEGQVFEIIAGPSKRPHANPNMAYQMYLAEGTQA